MTRHRLGLRKLCRLDRLAKKSHHALLSCGVQRILKTPTAGHRRTPTQFASAIAAEAEAGTNAGTLDRHNLRICKTCTSANPAFLHNLRICKTLREISENETEHLRKISEFSLFWRVWGPPGQTLPKRSQNVRNSTPVTSTFKVHFQQ